MSYQQVAINSEGRLYIVKDQVIEKLTQWCNRPRHDPFTGEKLIPGCFRWRELYKQAEFYQIPERDFCVGAWIQACEDFKKTTEYKTVRCKKCLDIKPAWMVHNHPQSDRDCEFCNQPVAIRYMCINCKNKKI
jgi:hypothetical protein